MANMYIRLLLELPIRDNTNGFRCYERSVLKNLDFSKIKHKGFITLSEVAYWLKKWGKLH